MTKNNSGKKILIVDDEVEMRVALETTLKREGYSLALAENGQQALQRLGEESFDLVLTDVKMPKMNGIELLKALKQQSPQTMAIMMTAYGDIDNAVETMKAGAFDYLLKPFSAEILVATVNRAFLSDFTPVDPVRTPPDLEKHPRHGRKIVTQNKEMQELIRFVENIAYSKSTILIMGDTGTGKELFARYIHQMSPRAQKSFTAINCAALPEGLLETELFGHEKGAFTGATDRKDGKFELAHKGTLLLDEVTEMSLPLQAKLLRVLQEHEIDKVGGRAPIPVDVRVIATTNRDIKQRIRENQFREDLYYRLNVIPLKLIPLRERVEDIPLLAKHFLEKHSKELNKSITSIADETVALLNKYRWPGNVRELENMIERASLICQGNTLLPSDLFFDDEEIHASSATRGSLGRPSGTIHNMEKEL
ncbi:MAG: sigma-54-dependent Fis family transcriptional regulator, partial [Nitrospinae bacterium]|nr:sigma-54-dependent Fis family transcriptional regulator [Nitrospinota bacterium]